MRTTVHFEAYPGPDVMSAYSTLPWRVRLLKFATFLKRVSGPGLGKGRGDGRPSMVVGTKQSFGTVTMASVADADAASINGVALTAENGGTLDPDEFDMSLATDILVASDFVRCLNASTTALITKVVKASNTKGTVTAASVAAGDSFAIDGVTFRASVAASPTHETEFTQSGSDTADAQSIVAKVNSHPTVSAHVYATNSSGVVTLWRLPGSYSRTILLSSSNGTRLAVSGASLAATAVVGIFSVQKGLLANAITLASSDGTRLAVSGARLTGATQTDYTF